MDLIIDLLNLPTSPMVQLCSVGDGYTVSVELPQGGFVTAHRPQLEEALNLALEAYVKELPFRPAQDAPKA